MTPATPGAATAAAADTAPAREPLTIAALTAGAPVWVWAFGRWRRGEVIRLARTRAQIRYVSDRHGSTRDRWWQPASEPVYDGRLPEPVTYQCVSRRCRLQVTGRPGQTITELRAEHEASGHHHRELA